jgi:hypothetical protein
MKRLSSTSRARKTIRENIAKSSRFELNKIERVVKKIL